MESLSFEQLPQAVAKLTLEIRELKQFLLQNSQPDSDKPKEKLMTVQEAANFLSLSVPTVYSKVSKSELPFMKNGKRLYFSNIELMDYLKKGRSKSNDEVNAIATNYIKG